MPDHPIRITGVKTLVVNAEMRNWIFVKVETDQDGLSGWGEASLNWKTRAVTGAIADLETLLLGKDPRDVEQIVRILNKQSYYRLGIVGVTAISGIEHALWDIFGKSLGLPVWRLLGGRTRDRVRVYTHLGLGDMRSVYETFDGGALRGKSPCGRGEGLRCAQGRVHPLLALPRRHPVAATRRAHDAGFARCCRRRGRHHDRFPRPSRLDLGRDPVRRGTRPYRPMFCEEPVQPGDTEALRMVTERGLCPIASGERLVGYKEFEPIILTKALNIVQPDLNHTGGLLEGKR
jgi:galactonate dehydratase